jgi:hypothetical protein
MTENKHSTKLNLIFLLTIILILSLRALGGTPKYGPNALPISKSDRSYFGGSKAPDFWTLMPYYVGQETRAGCSNAALVTVLNAVRSKGSLSSSDELVLQKDIGKYTNEKYAAEVSADPMKMVKNGVIRGGVSIFRLAEVLDTALEKLKLKTANTKVSLRTIDSKKLKEGKDQFHKDLVENEKSSDDYIIINFIQGNLTGDPEGAGVRHIATVGGYDYKKHLVLILDPDRQWYEPYWSPEDKVFESISDPNADRVGPGYIYLKIR